MKSGKKPEDATEQNMPDYRLSEAAKEDLIVIAQYGDEHFGIAQSDRYRNKLKNGFLYLQIRPCFTQR